MTAIEPKANSYVPERCRLPHGARRLATRIWKARRQRNAVRTLARLGALVWYDYELDETSLLIPNATPPGPRWLRKLLGDDVLRSVVAAEAHDDAQLIIVVEQFPMLRALALWARAGGQISDAGFARIESLTQLQVLSVTEAQITDTGLQHLSGLRRLERLILQYTPVTGTGLKHLEGLPDLRGLVLNETPTTDATLESLGALIHLRSLSLCSVQLTDAAMEYIETLNQLQSLELIHTQITDAGLERLASLDQLRKLMLDGKESGGKYITDAGMEHVARLSQLQKLSLYHTRVTEERVKTLRQALANCEIGWQPVREQP